MNLSISKSTGATRHFQLLSSSGWCRESRASTNGLRQREETEEFSLKLNLRSIHLTASGMKIVQSWEEQKTAALCGGTSQYKPLLSEPGKQPTVSWSCLLITTLLYLDDVSPVPGMNVPRYSLNFSSVRRGVGFLCSSPNTNMTRFSLRPVQDNAETVGGDPGHSQPDAGVWRPRATGGLRQPLGRHHKGLDQSETEQQDSRARLSAQREHLDPQVAPELEPSSLCSDPTQTHVEHRTHVGF